jgi:hypothetical protein
MGGYAPKGPNDSSSHAEEKMLRIKTTSKKQPYRYI